MIKGNLNYLVPGRLDQNLDVWATVTGLAPLRIRLDGESTALPYTPDTLVGPLVVSDRVWVTFAINAEPSFLGRRAIIIGVADGVSGILTAFDGRITTLEGKVTTLETKVANMEAAWLTTHTATLTNITLGTGGTNTFRHRIIGKTADWKWKVKLGTGGAVTGDPKFTVPFTPHASYVAGEDVMGRGMLYDTGVLNRDSVARLDSGSTMVLVAFGNTGNHAAISAGAPWTWALGDVMTAEGRTETA